MKPSKFQNYPITGICLADLEHSLFDISDVDDTTMEEIAEMMELQYCDHFFWNSLKEIAESLNIKKSIITSPKGNRTRL